MVTGRRAPSRTRPFEDVELVPEGQNLGRESGTRAREGNQGTEEQSDEHPGPLVPLKVAAGAFGDPQHIQDDAFEWVAVDSSHRLRPGMFVAQVVGRSMDPAIPDGAYCLFRAPVEGTRNGKTVLAELRNARDPETGQRYTVKRYRSEKARAGESWRHEKIILEPVNRDFEPIGFTDADEGELTVVAELVDVFSSEVDGAR